MPTRPTTKRVRKSKAPRYIIDLTAEERENALTLTHEAYKSNLSLIEAGTALDAAHREVGAAELNLRLVRADNRRLHAELAPLLHRLPA
jgi:hypothetical protein